MAEDTVLTGQVDADPASVDEGQVDQQGSRAPEDKQQVEPDSDKQEGQKQGEKEADKEGESQAPEAYEWRAPEGYEGELDQAAIEQFEPVARELGLTQEQADKMVKLHAESLQRANDQAKDNWAKQLETWQTELREDPEFGGVRFDENVSVAVKAVERFGSPGLKDALEQTGMGNHPELVRTFSAIGKAISEDKIHMGNQSHGERSAADILYPNEAKK